MSELHARRTRARLAALALALWVPTLGYAGWRFWPAGGEAGGDPTDPRRLVTPDGGADAARVAMTAELTALQAALDAVGRGDSGGVASIATQASTLLPASSDAEWTAFSAALSTAWTAAAEAPDDAARVTALGKVAEACAGCHEAVRLP